MMENNDIVPRYSVEQEEIAENWLTQFIKDLLGYIHLRSIQFSKIVYILFVISIDLATNLKSEIVRRMYWGRTSFYRGVFQVVVTLITIGALIASISSRTDILAKEESGIIASSGIIGSNDMFLQVGTTEAITEAEVSNYDYDIYKYVVQPGDSIALIADRYGVSQATIRWANNIPAGRDTLSVGQVLEIPPMNGILYTAVKGDTLDKIIKKVQNANKFDLIELNNLQPPDYTITVGQKLFIPDASYKPVVARRTTYTRSATYVNMSSTSVNVAPGTFVNPMQQCPGYKYVRGWRYTHTGVDLAHSPGCWIVAAGSGTVTRAGWCGSMGFCTVIKHDNGYSTLYMHGQGQFAVRAGQRVNAGQKIMTLGSTGRSYGPHLHISLAPPGVDVVNSYHGRINPAGIIPF